MKSEMQTCQFPLISLAQPSRTRGLTATEVGLACKQSAGQAIGGIWNWSNLCLRSKPGPLEDYPDPVLLRGKSKGRCAGSWTFTWRSTCNCDDEWKTVNVGSMLYSVDAILSVRYTWCMLDVVYDIHSEYCTWCMRYRLYAVLSISCSWCILYLVYVIVSVCSTQYMLYMESAVLDACQTCCMLYLVHAVYVVCCTRC